MRYRCPYCKWTREAPDPAEYEDLDSFDKAMAEFTDDQEHHDCCLVEV